MQNNAQKLNGVTVPHILTVHPQDASSHADADFWAELAQQSESFEPVMQTLQMIS